MATGPPARLAKDRAIENGQCVADSDDLGEFTGRADSTWPCQCGVIDGVFGSRESFRSLGQQVAHAPKHLASETTARKFGGIRRAEAPCMEQ